MSQPLECLDGPQGCEGEVEYRHPLSSTGKSFPRCEKHFEERLKLQEEHDKKYPDSPIAPAWFDPAAAGEHWDDDY